LKSDNRLERNHLQGKDGDRINAMLSACGFNMRKLIRAFFLSFFRWLFWRKFAHFTELIDLNMSETEFEMLSAHAF